jgi:hypothetical protein
MSTVAPATGSSVAKSTTLPLTVTSLASRMSDEQAAGNGGSTVSSLPGDESKQPARTITRRVAIRFMLNLDRKTRESLALTPRMRHVPPSADLVPAEVTGARVPQTT